MDTAGIRDTMKSFLLKQAVKLIEVPTLRSAFTAILAPLKEKTEGTENPFDDWAIEAFEALIADDSKMEIVRTFILSKLTGNLCESLDLKYGFTEYEALASALVHEPGKYESAEMAAGSWGSILAQILEVAIPVIIDWIQKRSES